MNHRISGPNMLGKLLQANTKRLAKAGIDSARLDTLILLEKTLDKDRSWILASQDEYELSKTQSERLESLVNRRLKQEPLAYITGICGFYGLELIVDESTLIPRPETETIISQVIKLAPNFGTIHDVGTGSGAIAIAIKHERKDLIISASDISQAALDIAQKNVSKYSLDDIRLFKTNLMNGINDKFDIITANLPYIPENRDLSSTPVAFEPSNALYSGKDGLDHYRELFPEIGSRLKSGGYLIIEAEPDQHRALITLAEQNGLSLKETIGLVLSFT
ncbi:peptide chain release factor N(5)-glutamine methyltransferase, partial [Candidatus Saccharibacteria bacterium]|nr:peptide chain release factor N(5)-glutamine methyltransferase [Candidatus Saccharibacteria bacterium]